MGAAHRALIWSSRKNVQQVGQGKFLFQEYIQEISGLRTSSGRHYAIQSIEALERHAAIAHALGERLVLEVTTWRKAEYTAYATYEEINHFEITPERERYEGIVRR